MEFSRAKFLFRPELRRDVVSGMNCDEDEDVRKLRDVENLIFNRKFQIISPEELIHSEFQEHLLWIC